MRNALRLGLLLTVLLTTGAARAAARPVPADTLPGQAVLTRRISTSMCQHLSTELPAGQDASKLSADECQALLEKLTVAAMTDNTAALQTMLRQAPSNDAAEAVGKDLGVAAVMGLVQQCPPAKILITRLGMLSSNLTDAPDAAERNVLMPIVQAVCKRLDEANAKQPLAQRPAPDRNSLMQNELQGAILAHATDLTGYYGDDVMDDKQKSQQIGEKIGLLMLEQCPGYLLLMSREDAPAPAPPPPAAAPKPKPRPAARKAPAKPAAKPAVKRPVKK